MEKEEIADPGLASLRPGLVSVARIAGYS